MTIESAKNKLEKTLAPLPTEVNKRGDYMRLRVELPNGCELVGYYELGADPDFGSIAAQCEAAEAKKAIDVLYIIDGSTIILEGAFAGHRTTEVVIPGSVSVIQGNNWGNGAFHDCPNLQQVTLCEGVRVIGSNTFSGCRSLKSITIPESVKKIRAKAFEDCRSLTEVKLPASLELLDEYAFCNCTSLTQIEMPEKIDELGDNIFRNCESLQSVTIKDGISGITDSMFRDCSSLQAINLPQSITKIGDGAFDGCKSLQDVVIPPSVTEIGSYAFDGCSSIKSIEIPAGISCIKNSTFVNCTSLAEVKIPDSVTEIMNSAFTDCSSLVNIKLPDGVTRIGAKAFYDCQSLTEINIPAECQLSDQAFYGSRIPDPIIRNNTLTYVPVDLSGKYVIPEGIEAIASYTFARSKVSEVVIPASVKVIGEAAFIGCENLTHVEIPGPVQDIDYNTFDGCKSLQSVTLPDSVTAIRSAAFAGSGLTSIVIPPNVRRYGERAFAGCKQLTEVTITNPTTPLSTESFAKDAFKGCDAITVVNLPKGITWGKIKEKFADSPWSKTNPRLNLKTAKNEKLAAMAKATYEAMAKAAVAPGEATVTVGNHYIEIRAKLPGQSALYAWFTLKDAKGSKIAAADFDWGQIKDLVAQAQPDTTYCVFEPGTRLNGELAMEIKNFAGTTANVALLSGVTEITRNVFANYAALRSITLPEGLTDIEAGAFSGTSLIHPVIIGGKLYAAPTGSIDGEYVVPAEVTQIMDYAFAGCDTLTSVDIHAGVTMVRNYAFRSCKALQRVKLANPIKFESIYTSTSPKDGITIVDRTAFRDSGGITEVLTPNSHSLFSWLLANL